MFRFEDPIYLYALVLIPVLALIRWWMMLRQRKRLRRFGDPQLVRQLMPDVSRFRPLVKFGLLLTALALLIVMLARPQMGTNREFGRSFHQRQDRSYRLCRRGLCAVAHHERFRVGKDVPQQHRARTH